MGLDRSPCTAASTCDPARATPAGIAPRTIARTSRKAARRRIVALSGGRLVREDGRVGDGGVIHGPGVARDRGRLRHARPGGLARGTAVADHRRELLAVLHHQAGRAREQGEPRGALLAGATGRPVLAPPPPRQQAPELLGHLRGAGLLWPAPYGRHGRAPRRRRAPPPCRPLGGLGGGGGGGG